MSDRHFIVFFRHAAWQYTTRGTITAPFSTRREAVDAAIAEAAETRDKDVEVIVQNPDLHQETVWRQGQATGSSMSAKQQNGGNIGSRRP